MENNKNIRVSDTESFIKKATAIHDGFYTYANVVWVASKEKVMVTCPTHGDFAVRAANHVTKTKPQGCKLCIRDIRMKTNEEFIKDCIKKHGDLYDLSKVAYTGATKPVIIGCKTHGEFTVDKAANFTNGSGCPDCGDIKSITKRRSNVDDLLTKFNMIHSSKYIYPDNLSTFTGLNDKITISCPIHGEFEQLSATHLNGAGCVACGRIIGAEKTRKTTEKYIAACIEKFGDIFDYSGAALVNGIGNEIITIICKKHNTSCQVSAKAHLNSGSTNCPGCNSFGGVSKQEKDFVDFVRTCLPEDEKIVESDNQTIKPKQLDVSLPDRNLAFEYCGVYWHQEAKGKDAKYHLNKHDACLEADLRLVQIFSNEWILQQEIVKSRVATMLKAPFIKKYNARSLHIKEVSGAPKREFLDRTHIQGNCSSSINLALVNDDGEIMSLMTFGKPRFNKNYEYELIRFSSELNSVVRGAASRLFKHFIKTYAPKTIISYSDMRWNTGNVYEGIGFEHVHDSKPNYFYFHEQDTHILFTRNRFQKHKLSGLLDVFDPALTEWQNMQANGYGRIWDCGNSLFLWKSSV